MKDNFYDMIYLYIEAVKRNVELEQSETLFDFVNYLNKVKEKNWGIFDITENDIQVYYKFLNSLKHKVDNPMMKLSTIRNFMKFAKEEEEDKDSEIKKNSV